MKEKVNLQSKTLALGASGIFCMERATKVVSFAVARMQYLSLFVITSRHLVVCVVYQLRLSRISFPFYVSRQMSSDKFIFGVDLDGVCGDFYGSMRAIAAEWKGVDINELPPDVSYGLPEWQLDEMGGYEPLHRFAVTQRDLFVKLPPMAHVRSVLRRLSGKGVHIRIITHRLFIKYFHQKAVSQTIEWLDDQGIPYWDLCFLQEKGDVGANIYIDDAPHNVERLRALGKEAIVYTNSTNREVDGLRCSTWLDVEAVVMEHFQKWEVEQGK